MFDWKEILDFWFGELDEHGLPESQCRACNPDLVIERPAPEET